MTPNDYRLRHPRCCTCVYWEGGAKDCKGYKRCRVKNKEMGCNDGRFCAVYKPRRFEG